jgi:uncharacterized protein (TIGR00369 family)
MARKSLRAKPTQRWKDLAAKARRTLKSNPATSLLGFKLESLALGRAVLRMDVESRHRQMQGVVHGGILAALADTASAIAAFTVVPPGTAIATVELKINYLEAVVGGRVKAAGRVLRAGRNFVITECELFDGHGALVAKALLTFGAASGHSLAKQR